MVVGRLLDGSRLVPGLAFVLTSAAFSSASSASVAAHGGKVNGPLVVGVAGDVTDSRISPDSKRVVYRADQGADEVFRIYSVPIAGGPVVALGAEPVAGGDVGGFLISPNSRTVVYLADQEQDEVFELYSASIVGRQPAIKLNPALTAGGDVASFQIGPRSDRVVYLAKQDSVATSELYSVPLLGGTPVRLNGALVAGGNVTQFALSPDGRWVVYLADQDADEVFELFGVALAGGTPVKLSAPQSRPEHFQISPDSAHVVYGGASFGTAKLYGVSILGGPSSALGQVRGELVFQISPNSRRVLFLGDGNFERAQLYSVALTGGPAKKITEHGNARIYGFQISPDSRRVAYSVEAGDSVGPIYTVPIDGPIGGGGSSLIGDVGYELFLNGISPDSSRVLWGTWNGPDGDGPILYSSPIAGGPRTRLTSHSVFAAGITSDSQRVVCCDYAETPDHNNVYSVPLTGGAEVQLNAGAIAGGGIVIFPAPSLSPDGTRIVYRADQDLDEVFELYSAPVAGGPAVKLNAPLAPGGIAGDVLWPQISPDRNHIVYEADQDTDQVFELYSAPVSGGTPIKLNGPLVRNGDVMDESFQISPDSARVVYVADQEVDDVRELYSVPIAGGPAVKLSGPPGNFGIFSFRISPDSRRVVFSSDPHATYHGEVFSVPIEGGPIVDLTGALSTLGTLESLANFDITPDSSRVVFAASRSGDQVGYELFCIPIDGGALLELSPTPVVNGSVGGFHVLSDSSGVVYDGDLEVWQQFELYHTPLAGGPTTKLSGLLAPDEDVFLFTPSPDAHFVVFRANKGFDQPATLYSVSLPGFVRAQLNPPLVAGGAVRDFRISDDSTRVLYMADQIVNERFELFSVPIAGGPAAHLNPTPVTGGDVTDFHVSPDSRRAVYVADQNANDVFEVFSVPIAGGTSTRLNAPLPAGGDVGKFGIRPNSRSVIFQAEQETNDVLELFAVPIEGGVAPVELNAPLVANGDVGGDSLSFFPIPTFLLAGNLLLYRADQDQDETVELYLVFLSYPIRDAPRSVAAASPPP